VVLVCVYETGCGIRSVVSLMSIFTTILYTMRVVRNEKHIIMHGNSAKGDSSKSIVWFLLVRVVGRKNRRRKRRRIETHS
jgi:hypothetical protein